MIGCCGSGAPLEEELPERRGGSQSKGLEGRPGLSAYHLRTGVPWRAFPPHPHVIPNWDTGPPVFALETR